MSYTTMQATPVCESGSVPMPGLPPLNETMRKTHDMLLDSNALADRLLGLMANAADQRKQEEPSISSMLDASIVNCELAGAVMHKLEQMLTFIGG